METEKLSDCGIDSLESRMMNFMQASIKFDISEGGGSGLMFLVKLFNRGEFA